MKMYKSYLDRISIGISVLCMIHCIVLPIFITTLTLWGIELLENRFIEFFTLLSTLVAGGWAIGKGYGQYHHYLLVPVLFASGLISVTIASFVAQELTEMLLKGFGAILIIGAHITNWVKCKDCCRTLLENTNSITMRQLD